MELTVVHESLLEEEAGDEGEALLGDGEKVGMEMTPCCSFSYRMVDRLIGCTSSRSPGIQPWSLTT